MEVHAPVNVPRLLEPLRERADQADDRRRRQGHDRVEPRQQQRLDHGPGVEAEVIGHPGPGPAPAQRGRRDAVDVDALVHFVRRRPGLARLVAALRGQDVALVPAARQRLGQVGQVLGRRGVVGPVILVDEQDPLAAAVSPAARAAAVRRAEWHCRPDRPRSSRREAWPLRPRAAVAGLGVIAGDASAVGSPFGVRLGLVGPVPGDRLGQTRLQARSAAPSRRAPASSG